MRSSERTLGIGSPRLEGGLRCPCAARPQLVSSPVTRGNQHPTTGLEGKSPGRPETVAMPLGRGSVLKGELILGSEGYFN